MEDGSGHLHKKTEMAKPCAMMAMTLSRRDRKRSETRERIFEAALTLLAERDFDAVTVEMITEAADVGKGTFFNYFNNKEALIAYYFESQLNLFLESLIASRTFVPDGPEQAPARYIGRSLWKDMTAITHTVIERSARSRKFVRTLMALMLTNDTVRAAHDAMKKQIHAICIEAVRMGQQIGELRDDLPPEMLDEYLSGIYEQSLLQWAESEESISIHDIVDRNFTLVYEGIRPCEVSGAAYRALDAGSAESLHSPQ